jgi:beta-lactamase regulating signal transducer with metallopeptidase domain
MSIVGTWPWLAEPWVHRLGWTLIQFLWQGAAIAGVFAVVRATIWRTLSSRARYGLACIALATMTLAPVLTFAAGAGVAGAPSARWLMPVRTGWDSFMPALVAVWSVGVLACSIRLAGGWLAARRLRTNGVRAAPADWQETFARLVRRFNIAQPVRLLVSSRVDVPVVVGWLRPVVLVPVGALTGLPAEYVTALLAHELAHVARRDYLVNLLQRVAESLLFYHPAVWWVSGQVRIEREMCCDDLAVAAQGDRVVYARALAELDAARASLHVELAANGGPLMLRIMRLLGQSTSFRQLMPAPPAVAGLIVVWIVGVAAAATRDSLPAMPPGPMSTAAPRAAAAPAVSSSLLATALLGPIGPRAVPSPLPAANPAQGGQPGAVAPPVPSAPLDRFATGTAVIRGRVQRRDTGAPLRRARVTLRRSGLAEPPAAVTDDQGRYELVGLPAGRFTVVALKDGFMTTEYGQDVSAPAGRPIELSDGEVFERADVLLVAGGVLSGQILDDRGEPQGSVVVRAMKQQFVDGVAVPGPAVGIADTTDDLGQFRVFALSEGEYFVGAVAGDPGAPNMLRPSPASFENAAKTFYPGTLRAREAKAVRVNAGEEVGGLVFSASPRRAFRISGTVTSATAPLGGTVSLSINEETMSGGRSFSNMPLKPDGSFTTGELAPGEYTLIATLSSDKTLTARTRVVLEDSDATAHLILKPGDTLRGRIAFDAGSSKASIAASSMRLVLDGPATSFQMSFSGIRVKDDWSFEAGGLGGPYRLQLRLPQGWALKSVRHAGRDVTDEPFNFDGADIEGVEITLTQQVTTVTGSVSDSRSQRSLEATVIVLADDPAKWLPGGRYVKRARLDDQGRFVIQGLPPGQYVAAAVTALGAGAETDPAMLARLRRAGVRLTLNDGESRNLELRVSAP